MPNPPETKALQGDMVQRSHSFGARLTRLVARIYPGVDADILASQVIDAFWPEGTHRRTRPRRPGNTLWSQRDAMLITYGDSIVDGVHKPLSLLHDFLLTHLQGVVNGVHVLPFFPWTSDDGFAVTDYRKVDMKLGDWADITRIGREFHLMSDLVLNHVSSQSGWFNAFLQGHAPYDRFFVTADPGDDLSAVVRPRTSPLLRAVETADGTKHVWCTFSHDQVDLDYSNPEVLLEMLRVIRLHIDMGVRIIRLDAVAFVWKEIGTGCIHLPETHDIVKLLRLLADFATESVVLLTETNVPNAENLSYFGNRNEAHAIYNFSLPPLMLHALLTGTSRFLNAWQMAMPPAQLGCAYLNFTASHDGIGVRPAEGLLDLAALTDEARTLDHQRARYHPLHFSPAIETASSQECLVCHQEILERKPLEESPAGVKAIDTLAWYQTLDTYEGEQQTFHWRHIESPFAKQVMNLECNFCHKGNDPREESPDMVPGKAAFSADPVTPAFTNRKMVNPSETCLLCHGAMPDPENIMGLYGPWHEIRGDMEDEENPNGCLTCHAELFRTVRHQVTYLNPEGIEEAALAGSDTCYGCHGGRQWYRISYPYPRHPWPDMDPETPDWAKDRPTQSKEEYRLQPSAAK